MTTNVPLLFNWLLTIFLWIRLSTIEIVIIKITFIIDHNENSFESISMIYQIK